MSEAEGFRNPMTPSLMSPEDWAGVEESWRIANEQLDLGVQAYREHREVTNCPHPSCVSLAFGEALEWMSEDMAKAILHAAIHRLETARLEKEAGL